MNSDALTKVELRKQFKIRRNKLNLLQLQEESQRINQIFFNCFDLNKIKSLHVFLPILKNREIDTWLFIEKIWQDYPDITLVVAKSELQTVEMANYILRPNTELFENSWGIPEPVHAEHYPDALIDMVLIPLLCFDQQGYRIGYGKGYYDKFLKKCRPDTIKIGLSLFAPVEKIADVMPFDVKMNFCVTPETVFLFERFF